MDDIERCGQCAQTPMPCIDCFQRRYRDNQGPQRKQVKGGTPCPDCGGDIMFAANYNMVAKFCLACTVSEAVKMEQRVTADTLEAVFDVDGDLERMKFAQSLICNLRRKGKENVRE